MSPAACEGSPPAAAVAAGWERALAEAESAAAEDEVPVGAVVLGVDGALLGAGHDRKMALRDPTAHAEVLAMRAAAARLGDWRLDGCTLLVTLEPCAMCAGAILLARLARVEFAADSPKFGAVTSLFALYDAAPWNHRPAVGRAPDAVAARAADLLRAWFRAQRAQDRPRPA